MTDTIIRRIMHEAEKNDGIIRTGQIEELGIPRRNIRLLLDAGALVKESKGLYSVPEISPDEYAVLQSRSDMLIFSYGTALFFHGLSDRVPHTIDITVPQGYNVGRLKKTYDNLRFHYVKPDVLKIGAVEVITPQGSKVTAYDKERCICDLIKEEGKIDKQIYTQAIKEYFSGEYKPRAILKIAKAIGVESEVRRYMEVL